MISMFPLFLKWANQVLDEERAVDSGLVITPRNYHQIMTTTDQKHQKISSKKTLSALPIS